MSEKKIEDMSFREINEKKNSWKFKEMEKLLGKCFKHVNKYSDKGDIYYYKLDKIICDEFIYFECLFIDKKKPFESYVVDVEISEIWDDEIITEKQYNIEFDKVKNKIKELLKLFKRD